MIQNLIWSTFKFSAYKFVTLTLSLWSKYISNIVMAKDKLYNLPERSKRVEISMPYCDNTTRVSNQVVDQQDI